MTVAVLAKSIAALSERIDRRFEDVDRRFDGVDRRFDQLHVDLEKFSEDIKLHFKVALEGMDQKLDAALDRIAHQELRLDACASPGCRCPGSVLVAEGGFELTSEGDLAVHQHSEVSVKISSLRPRSSVEVRHHPALLAGAASRWCVAVGSNRARSTTPGRGPFPPVAVSDQESRTALSGSSNPAL
jgi:hypothetical protein